MPQAAMIAPGLTEQQLDALREAANIGCGHAANALSRLVGGLRIDIDVPRAAVVDPSEVALWAGGERTRVVGVATEVLGALRGRLLVLMPASSARALAGLLLRSPAAGPAAQPLADDARSALREAGNILGSACLNALATAFHLRLLPSTPSLDEDEAGAVVSAAVQPYAEPDGTAVVLETRFRAPVAGVEGQLLIVPEIPSLPALLRAMGV